MDFFQQQEVARKKTGLLIFYFVATVAGLVGAIYAAMAGIFLGVGGGERGLTSAVDNPASLWDPALFGLVSAGTLGVIGVGTLYRVASLAGGGRVVAEMLQGRLIAPDTTDPTERKVLNVVEEMAIASGVPVPPVYLMDHEQGINAFAAGHKLGDAVIGVTRGTVENLSRAELQGVIAHEFSHILNGDMKLNLRLMGILFGILAISMIGYFILRATTGMRLAARDDGKKGANPLPLIGLALYVLGYVGLIGGRLIKSAISRQREYLADASAVQFTRDPSGIADALKKIGALSGGSRIRAEEAEEASHMFFGNAMGASLFGLMATHPPLVDRIRRLEPSFDGDFDAVRLAIEKGQSLSAAAESKAPAKERTRLPFDPVGAIGRIGTLDPARVAAAAAMLDSMPKGLGDHAREPFGARALVFALLLDRDEPDLRQNQLANLQSTIDPKTFEVTESLVPAAIAAPAEQRLPLVELALPALRRLSAGQYREFKGAVERLMAADRRLDLFEFALQRMILRHLGTQFERREPWPGTVKTDQPGPLIRPMLALLGAVAQSGDRDPAKAGEAFRVGLDALGWGRAGGPGASYPLLDRAALPGGPVGLREVREALDVLAGASPALKKDILRACATAIALDGSVTVEEGELLRAISDTLDCPMPPLGNA